MRAGPVVVWVLAPLAGLAAPVRAGAEGRPGTGPFHGKDFKGRIAWSADGNFNDEDDWAASPVALAILARCGAADELVQFDYNCILAGTDQAEASIKEAIALQEDGRTAEARGKVNRALKLLAEGESVAEIAMATAAEKRNCLHLRNAIAYARLPGLAAGIDAMEAAPLPARPRAWATSPPPAGTWAAGSACCGRSSRASVPTARRSGNVTTW